MKRSHGRREVGCGEWNDGDLISVKNLLSDLRDRGAHKENNVCIRMPGVIINRMREEGGNTCEGSHRRQPNSLDQFFVPSQ
jgi:hypothetical protein